MRENEKEKELKDWFKQVRSEQYEIEHLKELIKSAEYGLLPSGIRYDRDKVQTSPDDTMSKVLAKAVDMQRELENSMAKLQERRIETEKRIQKLGNSNEREVMRYYYLDTMQGKPLTWSQVAYKMSFDERWVRRLHNRAIEHLIERGA